MGLLSTILVAVWGLGLFVTFMLNVRDTRSALDVGLRTARLQILRFRLITSLSIGIPVFAFAFYSMKGEPYNFHQQMELAGAIILLCAEFYFVVRYFQLRRNFRRYALTYHFLDNVGAYSGLVGCFLSVLSLVIG